MKNKTRKHSKPNLYILKQVLIVLLAVILITPTLILPTNAASTVRIVLDGKEVVFTEDLGFPFIDSNDRTQVPFRVTLESFGAVVDWDNDKRMAYATFGDTVVHVPIGESYILVNGNKVDNDTKAVIVNDRTYCPIRKVLEAFGTAVTWDGNTRTVYVNSNLDDYTFMVFMNGTDLESSYDEASGQYAGAGTSDLNEMMLIGSNETVNYLVETGGTLAWANDIVDPSQNQRWLVEEGSLTNVGNLGKQNMGDSETLKNFIIWAYENYPAKHYVLDLWNHGGGPIVGYGVDEHFNYDALKLEELAEVLQAVKYETGIQFEVIGFDACLMASLEVAQTVAPYGNYLVASEELEPGHGWNYTNIFSAITKTPNMLGDALGKVIADSFYDQAIEEGTAADLTLSVIDLSMIRTLTQALNVLMTDIGDNFEDLDALTNFYKVIANSKAFGGNTEDQGYTDIIDLKDFASRMSTYYETSALAVLDALSDTVVYKIEGIIHETAGGLSIYLPFRDTYQFDENLQVLNTLDVSEEHKMFVSNYISKLSGIEPMESDDTGIQVAEPTGYESRYELIIGNELLEQTEEVLLNIYEFDETNYLYRSLGYDSLVSFDESSYSYFDEFGGYWTTLDGYKVSQQVVYTSDDFIEYEIPVILNNELVNLQATWFFDDTYEQGGYYELHGARKGIDETTGMPDKQLIILKEGDIIEPVFDVVDIETGELSEEIGPAITFMADSELNFGELASDEFMFRFVIIDFSGKVYYSDFYDIYFE